MGDKKDDGLGAKLTIRLSWALLAQIQRKADSERRKLADWVRLRLEQEAK